MKKLFDIAQNYKNQMTIADFALIKLCLTSMGVLIGLGVPKSHKKKVASCASVVFAFTYIPLITKFLCIALESPEKKIED